MLQASGADQEFKCTSTLSNISDGKSTDLAYDATFSNIPIIAKLDPGASHTNMSKTPAKKCNLKIFPIDNLEIELGHSSMITAIRITKANLTIDCYTVPKAIFIIEMSSFCNRFPFMTFGGQWLHEGNPIVD